MKKLGWIVFSLVIMIMSWESQKSAAAIFAERPIPEESIRLRIIANSDSPQDQWLKREIRDDINAYLATKVEGLESMEEAKRKMQEELPQLQQIVDRTIEESGFSYNSQVELGTVPFPTKMYGQYVYPAGDYEALRVTVGEGLGQNWWCVLFPPLCFVDISTGDAVKQDGSMELAAGEEGPKVEVKFFLFEVFQKLFQAIFN